MKTTSFPVRILLTLFVLSLTGCATPKPIRNVAEQGAATVALAEISLREYVSITNAQLTARMDLVRQDSQSLAADRTRRELDRLLDESAGISASDEVEKMIRRLGEQRRKIREKEALAHEQIAAALKLDTVALAQVPTEKLADAKKYFSVLAQELTPAEWIELTAGYAQEISDGIRVHGTKEGGKQE